MVNSDNEESVNDRRMDDTDHINQSDVDACDSTSSLDTSTAGSSAIYGVSSDQIGLMERLTDIFVDEGDGDLLIQRNDREDNILQFLQALDMQVVGACRADERLKPLLKLNVSSGAPEDHLLAQLSQHFEPSEVGMLARCLCVPLVSIRIGKINKQGTLLCPTAARGNLNLTLLPTSDVRVSFIGDDGLIERIATLTSDSQCSAIAIEQIEADNSGRSLSIRVAEGEIFYFWCTEKSMFEGNELLDKMKDLLRSKPSLAELTGISESRLDCFAICLRAYIVQSSMANAQARSFLSTISSQVTLLDSPEVSQSVQSLSAASRTSRFQHYSGQAVQANPLYQGSLSPRPNSFKAGLPRNLSSLRTVAKEKFRHRGDNHHLSCADNLSVASPCTSDPSIASYVDTVKFPGVSGSHLFPPSRFIDSFEKSVDLAFLSTPSQVNPTSSCLFSPYYCWCPPVASIHPYTIAPQLLPISACVLPLPRLSCLLSSTMSSGLLTAAPPVSLTELPSLDLPPFLSEPLARLPMSMPSSQEIPTFTPLMCDSIVHIPVIDICSSGQGYLVSAGPAISTNIPPLYPKLVNPLTDEADSLVDDGARDTLHLLINSQSISQLEELSTIVTYSDVKPSIVTAGSRGLYCGSRDVGAIANGIAALGFASLSNGSVRGNVVKSSGQNDLVEKLEKSGSSDGCDLDDFRNLENM